MIGTLGTTEILLIFGVFVMLFGASKLPELAKSFGRSVGEFKKAKKEMDIEVNELDG